MVFKKHNDKGSEDKIIDERFERNFNTGKKLIGFVVLGVVICFHCIFKHILCVRAGTGCNHAVWQGSRS